VRIFHTNSAVAVSIRWNHGKWQIYEDNNQILGGTHFWRWIVHQRLRQKANCVVSVA
jgi:hypothetical protein